jgi:hypothetical protein
LIPSLGKCENIGRQQPGKEKSRRGFGNKTTERNEGCTEIDNNENQEREREREERKLKSLSLQ